MHTLLPDRLKELWGRVERKQLTAADAGYQQERLLDEYRVMKEHGHLEYLRNYLTRSEDLRDIAIYGLGELIAETEDDEEQRSEARAG